MKTFETTIQYDEKNNLLYVHLPHMREVAQGKRIAKTQSVPVKTAGLNGRINLDLDKDNRVVGIELEDFKLQVG
jgi:uncharacterized protein YuzE